MGTSKDFAQGLTDLGLVRIRYNEQLGKSMPEDVWWVRVERAKELIASGMATLVTGDDACKDN